MHYPIPVQLNKFSELKKAARAKARNELLAMLKRLELAELNGVWAAVEQLEDDGSFVLLTMIDALLPVAEMNAGSIDESRRKVKVAAGQLIDAVTDLQRNGFTVSELLPRPTAAVLRAYPRGHARAYVENALRDPSNLLATVSHLSRMTITKSRQRRGAGSKRRAIHIGLELLPWLRSPNAAALASAATGISITARALTKRN